MVAFNKMTAIPLLVGVFIFFVIIFCLIVCCIVCLMWLRRKEEDQEYLMNSGMNPKDLDDEEATSELVSRRRGHKRNNANDEVFEMEVFHYSEGNEESQTQRV